MLDQNASRRWAAASGVAWTGSAPRIVAVVVTDSADATPIALEGSAAVIWECLWELGEASGDTIVQRVSDQVGVAATTIGADVLDFLARLAELGLVCKPN